MLMARLRGVALVIAGCAVVAALPAAAAPQAARAGDPAVAAAGWSTWVPKGHKLVEAIHGDLNKDGQDDAVLLIKATDKSGWVTNHHGERVDRNRRGLIILFKGAEGYQLALRNLTCFASENEDGGVYFPPELFLEIKKGSLLISYMHGRYGYWGYNFRHQNGDFQLIGYDSSNNHGPVVESTISINLLSNKMLQRVNINQAADAGEERFKETWSKVKQPKVIKLSGMADFDAFDIQHELGLRAP